MITSVDVLTFEASLKQPAPPAGVSRALEALWHERHGDWDRAHTLAQEISGAEGAWVHAYLHRREGDQSNAEYWYRRASKPVMAGQLDDEWRAMVEALLDQATESDAATPRKRP
jgi:hypothetical protein